MSNKAMIGYDIDGVLQPDIKFDNITELLDLLEVRAKNWIPLFEPKGDYIMITGRPIEDKAKTNTWIGKYFDNPPNYLFHGNPNIEKGAEYKLKVLKNCPNIKVFIESDIKQVKFLQDNLPDRNIIHYATFIKEKLSKLI